MDTVKPIYFDHAATTPLDPAVRRAMEPYFRERFGNPGSLHAFGQAALAAVDRARESIAKTIGCPPAGGFRELIFTGSATEANNLALRGALRRFRERYPRVRPRLVVSAIEHEAVLETARDLGRENVEVVILPVDGRGVVGARELERALDDRTALVSVMYVNNEIGTVEPIKDIARRVAAFRKKANTNRSRAVDCVYPLFHTDAAQAFPYLACDVRELGVDMMTLSGHKMGGPKGIGALYRKDLGASHEYLAPILTGGGQEFGLRSGTENVPAIAGFAASAELAGRNRSTETRRVAELRDLFWRGLHAMVPDAQVNGPDAEGSRAPHILNVFFPAQLAADLLLRADRAGIAISSGSACSARASKPSHVILALGHGPERAVCSVRFSFGRTTTAAEVHAALRRLRPLLAR